MTEIRNQITQTQKSREILRDAPVDWRAPIEHLFIGSTPPPVKGKYIEVRGLLKKAQEGDGESLGILLTPMALQEETRRLKDVRRERKWEKEEKGNTGMMTIFDIEWQIDLSLRQHMSLWIEPSPIDDEGRIRGEWKIWVLDSKENIVEDPESIRDLSLREDNKQWFSLETVKGKPYKLLKLNFGK